MSTKSISLTPVKVHYLPDGRVDTKNAAAYLGLSAKTMAMMRSQGRGPKFYKRGRIFYYIQDLDEWFKANGPMTSTAQSLRFANGGAHHGKQ